MTRGISRRNVIIGFAATVAGQSVVTGEAFEGSSHNKRLAVASNSTGNLLDHLEDQHERTTLRTAHNHNALFDRFIQDGGGIVPWLGFPWRLSRRWIAGQWPAKPGRILFEPAPDGQEVVIYDGPLPNSAISERWGIFEPDSGWVIASSKPRIPAWISSTVPEPNIFITQWRGKSDFTIRDIYGRNMGGHRTTAAQENYDLVILSADKDTRYETCSRDFRIIRCGNSFSKIFGQLRDGGISILYSRDGKVVGGSCIRGTHGVMLWGGDARTDGLGQGHDWNNQRKCLRISVIGFKSSDVGGAFCWASMAERCEFVNCTGDIAGDVGFDWEGSLGCAARGCVARNAQKGNFACFFHCDQIEFVNCSSFVNNADFPLFRMYTESNDSTQNRKITIDGGTWTSYAIDKTGSIDTAYGCCSDITIKNIYAVDCTITTAYNHMSLTKIVFNSLVFTRKFPDFSAIRGGFSKVLIVGGEIVRGQTVISGNSIRTIVEQATTSNDRLYGVQRNYGSVGIDIIDNDPSHSSFNLVELNKISDGFLTPLLFRSWTADPKIQHVTRALNNVMGVHSDSDFRPIVATADSTGMSPPLVITHANKLINGIEVDAITI